MTATTSLSIILANQALNAADAEVTAGPPFPVAAGGLRPPAFIMQHKIMHAAREADAERCKDKSIMPP